jgi:hypothetical protein
MASSVRTKMIEQIRAAKRSEGNAVIKREEPKNYQQEHQQVEVRGTETEASSGDSVVRSKAKEAPKKNGFRRLGKKV